MNNSIVVNLIKRLDTRELSKFREYICSPYFNKREKIKVLYEKIIRCAPLYKPAMLDKRKLFAIIFKEQDYNELQINNLASNLLALLYDFLAMQQYQRDNILQKQLLIKELLKREIHDHIDRNARAYTKLQSGSSVRNFEYFHDEYEMHNKMDQYFLTKGIRAYDEHLQQKSDSLDLYYIGNKLRIAVDMTSRNFVSNAGYQCHFLSALISSYEENNLNLQQYPAISIYYKILLLLKSSQQEEVTPESGLYYFQLKSLLSENLNLFPHEELRVIYLYLQNHCIYKINSGQSEYYAEILDLYKFLLEHKIIFKNGYLPQWAYKNIVTAGIRSKNFDWTEEVIHSYRESLLPGERENVVAYNLAAFYYAKKAYKKALQQLHNVEFTDNSYHLGAKIIQLKSYYETDETEAFFALVEAFRKYVRRNRELADYRKKANLHFLKIAKEIYQLRLRKSMLKASDFSHKLLAIEHQLNALSPIANKDWLIQILNRL